MDKPSITDSGERASRTLIDRILGPVLALIAFTVYVVTLSRGAHVGPSVEMIVQYTGLTPQTSPMYPVWALIARAIAALPVGGLAYRLNMFSAICGAMSVWLTYTISSAMVLRIIDVEHTDTHRTLVAARIAGTTSALSLAFCAPFWIISNRALPVSLQLLMLLFCARILLVYADTGSKRSACVFAFLFCAGIVESSTFIALSPFVACYFLLLMVNAGHIRQRHFLHIITCAAAGLALYPLAAWWFKGSAGYHLKGYESYFEILWYLWRDQFYIMTKSLSQAGWITVFLITTAPWLVSLSVASRALNAERDWGFYMLHGVFTALAVVVLVNGRPSPWWMFGRSNLLVTPYVPVSLLMGYVTAYWYMAPTVWWPHRMGLPPYLRRVRRSLGAMLALPCMALVVIMPFYNHKKADGTPMEVFSWYANRIIDSLEPLRGDNDAPVWLVCDTPIGMNLTIAAHDRGFPLQVCDLRGSTSAVYSKYISSFFEDTHTRNVARIGLLPLLQYLLENDPDFGSRLALLSDPDLFMVGGFSPVPNKLVFTGTKDIAQVDMRKIYNEHIDAWDDLETSWRLPVHANEDAHSDGQDDKVSSTSDVDLASALTKSVFRQASFVANNLGVALADQEMYEEAYSSYSRALHLYPENPSALLNLYAMTTRSPRFPFISPAQSNQIVTAVEEFDSSLSGRQSLWSLSRHYGYVRSSEAFANLGWGWIGSGRPGLAAAGIQRAIDLVAEAADGDGDQYKPALARAYLAEGKDLAAEKIYRALLKENPEHLRALRSLARLVASKGEYEEAFGYLRRADAAGLPKAEVALEAAVVNLLAGNRAKARIILQELVELKPNYPQAWVLLAGVVVEDDDPRMMDTCIEKLRGFTGVDGVLASVMGARAYGRQEWASARKYLQEARYKGVKTPYVLETVLRLDLVLNRPSDTELHAREMLHSDPDNAFAYYALGHAQMQVGEYDLAKDSLETSIRLQPSPNAFVDLGWVLLQEKQYEEAEEQVRKAIALAESDPGAWSTLGQIMLATGRLEDAQEALKRAASVVPDNATIKFHMARLEHAKGNTDKASEMIEALDARIDEFSEPDKAEFKALSKALKSSE